jgi:hypothetical protein
MAKMLNLEVKGSGEGFRLICGAVKSDMSLPAEEKSKKIQQRLDDGLSRIKEYMKENEGDEIVVKGVGFAD